MPQIRSLFHGVAGGSCTHSQQSRSCSCVPHQSLNEIYSLSSHKMTQRAVRSTHSLGKQAVAWRWWSFSVRSFQQALTTWVIDTSLSTWDIVTFMWQNNSGNFCMFTYLLRCCSKKQLYVSGVVYLKILWWFHHKHNISKLWLRSPHWQLKETGLRKCPIVKIVKKLTKKCSHHRPLCK